MTSWIVGGRQIATEVLDPMVLGRSRKRRATSPTTVLRVAGNLPSTPTLVGRTLLCETAWVRVRDVEIGSVVWEAREWRVAQCETGWVGVRGVESGSVWAVCNCSVWHQCQCSAVESDTSCSCWFDWLSLEWPDAVWKASHVTGHWSLQTVATGQHCSK